MKKVLTGCLIGFALIAPGAAAAADAWVLGLTGDMTGRDSANSGAAADAIRIYFERVNAKGGIQGRKVEVLMRDNQSEPSRAATDAQVFVNNDDLQLIVSASLSSTYAPTIAEAKRKGVPILFSAGVCPTEVFPPKADPLLFCTSGYAAEKDVEFAVDTMRKMTSGAFKLGLLSMAIPISRGGMEHAAKYSAGKSIQIVGHESAPPPTVNYAPYATKLKDAGADWVLSWAPWITQVKTFEALRQQGWTGKFITYGHNVAEEELKRLKDPGFLVFTTNAMFSDNQPIHADIQAASAGKTKYPHTYLNEGWIAATVIEAALKKVAWPPSRAKVAEAMNGLSVELGGLRGGAIVWSAQNHYRKDLYYRVYGWDSATNRVKTVVDWVNKPVN